MNLSARKGLIALLVVLAVFAGMILIIITTTVHYGTPVARPLRK